MLPHLAHRLKTIVASLGAPMLFSAVCQGAEVQIVKPSLPPGVVLLQRPRLNKLREDVQRLKQGKGLDTDKLEVLAWAARADTFALPPALSEEIIVLVPERASEQWHVFYLLRMAEQWSARVSIPFLPFTGWHGQYDRRPTEAELIRFVYNTRFGNNRLDERFAVLAVYLYESDMPKLRRELSKGISETERRRRLMDLIGTGRRSIPDGSH